MGGLEYWDVGFSYTDRETGEQRTVGLPETGGGLIISGEALPAGSVYTVGIDASERAARKLALFLIQTQVNPGSGRIIPLGNLSTVMKEALKVAHAYLLGHIRDLGIDRDPRQYDFSVQAVNLNQAKEGSETAIGFFISLVSALLERPVDPTSVVIGRDEREGHAAEGGESAGAAGARARRRRQASPDPEREQARHRRRAGRAPQPPPDGLLHGSAQRGHQGDGSGVIEPVTR